MVRSGQVKPWPGQVRSSHGQVKPWPGQVRSSHGQVRSGQAMAWSGQVKPWSGQVKLGRSVCLSSLYCVTGARDSVYVHVYVCAWPCGGMLYKSIDRMSAMDTEQR